MEKHLSNLYHRVHKLENEIFQLKKVIFLFLFVISITGTTLFFGAIFSYIINSFLSIIWTKWLPIMLRIFSNILFNFSPIMILVRLIFLSFYFFICFSSSQKNILSIIICLIIAFFNSLILILYLLIYHFNICIFMLILIIMIKFFLYEFRDQINLVFFHSE